MVNIENREEMMSFYLGFASKITGSMVGIGTAIATGDKFFGPAIGIAIAHTLETVGKDIIKRTVSPRQTIRVARVLTVASIKLKSLQRDGKLLRNDGFFEKNGDASSVAEEVTEAIFLAAMAAAEEKKVDFIGSLLAYIATTSNIDQGTAHLLIEIAQNMTYRSMIILKVAAEKEKFSFSVRPREGGAAVSSYMHPLMVESFNLTRQGIIEMKDKIDDDDSYAVLAYDEIDPARLHPSTFGQILYEGLELRNMTENDPTLDYVVKTSIDIASTNINMSEAGSYLRAYAAGDIGRASFVNVFQDHEGKACIRPADAFSCYAASGFIKKAVSKGDQAKVFTTGEMQHLRGLIPGQHHFLANAGKYDIVDIDQPQSYSQIVGFAASTTILSVQIKDPIFRA